MYMVYIYYFSVNIFEVTVHLKTQLILEFSKVHKSKF